WGASGRKFGASSGDQTTGGQVSFGLRGSPNRALGLLATSSTGPTAFGLKLINESPSTLNFIDVALTAELWRQSDLPKTLAAYYFIDLVATNNFPTGSTALLPAVNVVFPTLPSATGGMAVDGTLPSNQIHLGAANV